ncbi:MAG: ABC transporter permease [Candidatus Pristimantibacillus lignocellulolyticus]|uniref:ABC transporter permease n=1 Tax=Candidatus Pristimantibacillus lignocellulolyticus TaxID=2994561 RepID=A0A9J6ZKP5_9BACL|nr:MAG: ABC transporter permease [Candidatus Pristimantibacillus lignocellulolyticus]
MAQLFKVRLKQHYIRIYKVLESICDWSVWLYIIIPAIVIFIGFYREWWMELPQWAIDIPWDIVCLISITFIVCIVQIKILVEDADQVVLIQKPRWLLSLKRFGLAYSWFVLQLITLIVPLVLLPFLVQVSKWNAEHILMLVTYIAISSIIPLIVNHRLTIAASWWKKLLLQLLIFIINSCIIFVPIFLYLAHMLPYWIGITSFLIIALILIRNYAMTPLNFQQHLTIANESKLMFTQAILSQSMNLTSTSKRKKPILFKNSQRLSRRKDVGSIIGEIFIKSLMRDFNQLKVWLMFLSVSCFAVTQVPGYAPLAIIIFLAYIAFNLFNLQWELWCKQDFVSLYMKLVEQPLKARSAARNPLITLFILIWLIVATCMQLL